MLWRSFGYRGSGPGNVARLSAANKTFEMTTVTMTLSCQDFVARLRETSTWLVARTAEDGADAQRDGRVDAEAPEDAQQWN